MRLRESVKGAGEEECGARTVLEKLILIIIVLLLLLLLPPNFALSVQGLTNDTRICAIDRRSGMADAAVRSAAEADVQPGRSGSL